VFVDTHNVGLDRVRRAIVVDAELALRFHSAVARQADIARWHVDEITSTPIEAWREPTHLADGSIAPPIAAQAHIEGCMHALRNAEDKFYEGLIQLYRLNETGDLDRNAKYRAVRESLERDEPRIAQAFDEWSDAFIRDVRSVRNTATYRAEVKRPVEDDWILQDPGSGTGYTGERKARDYCAGAAVKARELLEIFTMFIDAEANHSEGEHPPARGERRQHR
jgi:hypothetical protein